MPDFDVLVAGELNPDLILSDPCLEPHFGQQETLVESAELTTGSSSAIFACGAARLGLRLAFIGVVGDDLLGQFMLNALRSRGVDVTPVLVDISQRTGLSVILNRGPDRAILTYAGAISALRADQVTDDLLRRACHLHVASYFLQTSLQPGLSTLFRRAHGLGLTTSLDTNWDPSGGWSGVKDLLPLTDVFLPNAAEAMALTRSSTLEGALTILAHLGRTLVVKLGQDGAIARRGEETARCPAPSVPLADTIGAGDSFDAGFLYGWLNHWPLDRSLSLAVVCGSLSIRAHGGVAAQPTLQEALPFLPAGDHGPG